MNQTPPQLPPGWIALWDESAQRYYYVEQATGTTQWEVPTTASKAAEAGVGSRGEASSYGIAPQGQQGNSYPQQGNSYPQQGGSYPQQGGSYPQQDSSYPQSSSYPQQGSSYPQQSNSYPQQQSPGYSEQSGPTNSQQPQTADGPDGERGIGKIFTGFSGGAITGTLIGLAAGKLLGNNHNQSGGQQQYSNYGPPQGAPPQGYYAPPQNYGQPPKKHHHFW